MTCRPVTERSMAQRVHPDPGGEVSSGTHTRTDWSGEDERLRAHRRGGVHLE